MLSGETIQQRIAQMGHLISTDYQGKDPLFIAVLNGAFMFAADLLRNISIPCEISFVKLSSYKEMKSTGTISQLVGLNADISGRHVIILEDIIDSGTTISWTLTALAKASTSSVEIASLLLKPEALTSSVRVKYLGFKIPNKFVVGYGLDYDGLGRNTASVYQIKS